MHNVVVCDGGEDEFISEKKTVLRSTPSTGCKMVFKWAPAVCKMHHKAPSIISRQLLAVFIKRISWHAPMEN